VLFQGKTYNGRYPVFCKRIKRKLVFGVEFCLLQNVKVEPAHLYSCNVVEQGADAVFTSFLSNPIYDVLADSRNINLGLFANFLHRPEPHSNFGRIPFRRFNY